MSELFIEITFSASDNGAKPVIRTNMKRERVFDVLSDWLRDQFGKGSDESPVVEQDEYKITIGLDPSDDSFTTKSDTGNKSLTCGIVFRIIHDVNKGEVEWRE